MANGRPGDHPLTDILNHKIDIYGNEADSLIREIAKLCNPRELNEWWTKEIGWSEDHENAKNKSIIRLNELQKRAKESGWEQI